ncbi:MAG: DUF1648 domain-containing protein [Chloroflexi bacterium]|nr:DUF1648 domain-containing protein [Chloroflexota bacterium]
MMKQPGPPGASPPGASPRLPWRYVLLPLAVFLLSLAVALSLYGQLPGEVAYHFDKGQPDRWAPRSAVIALLLVPQLLLVLLAAAVVWIAARISVYLPQGKALPRLLLIMGNMALLPQLILSFAMLEVFSYNLYRAHLMPLWAFALAVMGLGGIALAFFFTQAWRSRGNPDKR